MRAPRTLRAIAAVVAMALAISAAMASWSFVWCAPMQEAMLASCCPGERSPDDRISQPCCEDRAIPELASVNRLEVGPRTCVAPLSAILPLAHVLAPDALLCASAQFDDQSARAGPAQRRHARLSVYLL